MTGQLLTQIQLCLLFPHASSLCKLDKSRHELQVPYGEKVCGKDWAPAYAIGLAEVAKECLHTARKARDGVLPPALEKVGISSPPFHLNHMLEEGVKS